MAKEMITPATAASSVKINMFGNNIPCTIIASGLTGAEEITVEIETADESTYVALYLEDAQVKLTATDNTITFYGPGEYKFVKPLTAGNVGLYMSSEAHR